MLRRANHIGCDLRIGVHRRRIEGAKAKSYGENTAERPVYVSRLQKPSLHRQWNIRLVLYVVGVASCLDRGCSRLYRIFGNMVSRNQEVDSSKIVGYKAVELPLPTQNV